MYKYKINTYWSKEDNFYIADVPELPGCMSDGETRQEAVSNAEVIINEWIEMAKELGREIPCSNIRTSVFGNKAKSVEI